MQLRNVSLSIVFLASGCATWPTNYNGVSVQDVHDRYKNIYELSYDSRRHRAVSMPQSCHNVTFNAGSSSSKSESAIESVWERCLLELDRLESKVKAEKVEERRRLLAEKKARAQEINKDRQDRLREYGVDFYDLYARAVHEGAKKYNAIISKYEKIDLRSIYIKNCSDGTCTAGYQSFSGAGTSGPPDILIRGIYAEPGTPLSVYKFVRFENYGRAPLRSVVAIFAGR